LLRPQKDVELGAPRPRGCCVGHRLLLSSGTRTRYPRGRYTVTPGDSRATPLRAGRLREQANIGSPIPISIVVIPIPGGVAS
jgi:hypothetical protein